MSARFLGHFRTIAIATVLTQFGTAQAAQFYFNGFEANIAGWDAFGGGFNATRVPSGTNGVTSASGSFHGVGGAAATNGAVITLALAMSPRFFRSMSLRWMCSWT